MRIISGKYRGRKIEGYDIVGTRPTMDRVKESVFGMIQNYLKGATCLDLFAGSGSLGIEALSNGAYSCYFVDNNKKVITTLNNNIKALNITEEVHIMENDYINALKKLKQDNVKFDIIFLDPPYKDHIIEDILDFVDTNDLLKPNGLIVCEYEFTDINNEKFTIFKERIYGSKKIKVFKCKKG